MLSTKSESFSLLEKMRKGHENAWNEKTQAKTLILACCSIENEYNGNLPIGNFDIDHISFQKINFVFHFF